MDHRSGQAHGAVPLQNGHVEDGDVPPRRWKTDGARWTWGKWWKLREDEGFISVFSDFDWSDDSNIRNHYNILNYIKLIDVILYTSTNDYWIMVFTTCLPTVMFMILMKNMMTAKTILITYYLLSCLFILLSIVYLIVFVVMFLSLFSILILSCDDRLNCIICFNKANHSCESLRFSYDYFNLISYMFILNQLEFAAI